MTDLTPREIVSELDRFIIGQRDAKRAVAVALRNRWRRRQLDDQLKDEVTPKNILMIGPTGVGKTEISRRLAKLVGAPFVKVEATKFTEVGYVGRDVDSIVRDLVEVALQLVRERRREEVRVRAQDAAENRVIDALVGDNASEATRESFRRKLRDGLLNDKEVEIDVMDQGKGMPSFDIPGMPGSSVGMINLNDMMKGAFGGQAKRKTMRVEDAYKPLIEEESDKLLDDEQINAEALSLVENEGIVFLDEIDKVAKSSDRGSGDVSREGVQRDLLPLIEGSVIATKHGSVKTDHILFIASGAFHLAKPSDLLPELQGRLPIRVELRALTREDFRAILTDTEASLLRQYEALIDAEGVKLSFTEDGIDALADMAAKMNERVENIGARRLSTILEKVLEEVSFSAPDRSGEEIAVDKAFVEAALAEFDASQDLSKFIL
ncbi:MAG: ATP-dependent protease ATPase subunit HslU [Parvularculaceae bacterium]|nr:ATP-dependent protease ATPase subunit HslU [Parvularculaceae bacterium]